MGNFYEIIAIIFAAMSGLVLFYMQISKRLFFIWQSEDLLKDLSAKDKKLLLICLISFILCILFLVLSF